MPEVDPIHGLRSTGQGHGREVLLTEGQGGAGGRQDDGLALGVQAGVLALAVAQGVGIGETASVAQTLGRLDQLLAALPGLRKLRSSRPRRRGTGVGRDRYPHPRCQMGHHTMCRCTLP